MRTTWFEAVLSRKVFAPPPPRPSQQCTEGFPNIYRHHARTSGEPMNPITHFKGEFDFLSNFFPCEVEFEGRRYLSTEAAYQAAKTSDKAQRRKFERMKPAEAKTAGRQLKLRSDWESVKDNVMLTLLREKFYRHPELRDQLLATGSRTLIEGNWWKDTYWGVCNGVGLNKLGKLLMQVRSELRDQNENGIED